MHIEADSDPEYLTDNWEFALFELSSSHYAAVCMERDISHSGGYLKSSPFQNISEELKLTNLFNCSLLFCCILQAVRMSR